MANKIIITTELCATIDNCRTVELKLSQEELSKFQLVTTSTGEIIDYSAYREFFIISFSITLSFWVLAKSIGIMLSFLKRV